jgi:hypothetical protein
MRHQEKMVIYLARALSGGVTKGGNEISNVQQSSPNTVGLQPILRCWTVWGNGYRRFYLQPKNMVKLLQRSFELGEKAVQLLADRPVDALIEACNSTRLGLKTVVALIENA